MVYRTTLPPGPKRTLRVDAVHDFGWVFLNNELHGVLDRRHHTTSILLPARTEDTKLTILVYALGRVNFGTEVHDRKGLHGPATITDETGNEQEVATWTVYPFPLSNDTPPTDLTYGPPPQTPQAGCWRGTFMIEEPVDTFLNVRSWGMGVVWINGRCLGRFWNIGPTQTMYLPGPWLRNGENEIVILDLLGPHAPQVHGQDTPILDELRPALDFSGSARREVELCLIDEQCAHEESFPNSTAVQTVSFTTPMHGRYVGLEALSTHGEDKHARIAELDIVDANGEHISHNGWTIAHVDSEERTAADGTAENAIDGQTASAWHSRWSVDPAPFPHRIVIDLGQSQEIYGFTLCS